MYGNRMKNRKPNNIVGVAIKNFDFSFWDFIKHPIASINKENINAIVRIIMTILNIKKNVVDTTLSKLFI